MNNCITKEKLTKYLAISIALMLCTTHLSMAAGNVFYAISILLGITICYKHKSFEICGDNKEYFLATVIFFASLLPSVIFSGAVFACAKSFFNSFIFRFLVFVLMLGLVKNRDYIVKMLSAFILVTSIDCLVAVYQVVIHYGTPEFARIRGWGFGSNTLTIAGIMMMLAPLVIVFLYDDAIDKRLKNASKIFLPCLFAGLWANKSRSTWLFMPIELIPVMWEYVRKSTKHMMVLFAVVCTLGTFFVVNPTYNARLKSVANVTTDRSNGDRIESWISSWEMIKDNPITGVGVGKWRQVYQSRYKRATETQNLVHSHNNFVQILAESGIIGFLGFLYFCFFFLYKSGKNWWHNKNPYDLLIFCVFGGYLMVFGQIEYVLDNSSGMRIFWFIIASLLQMKQCGDKGK